MSVYSNQQLSATRVFPTLLIALCLVWPCLSSAEKAVHGYKDENGVWHFTDDTRLIDGKSSKTFDVNNNVNVISSDTGKSGAAVFVPEEVCRSDANLGPFFWNTAQGRYGKKGTTELIKEESDTGNSFYFKNDYFIPVAVTFKLTEATNISTSERLPLTVNVPPHSKVKLLDVNAKNKEKAWQYRYWYKSRLGTLNAQHDDDCFYIPPVEPGKAYYISQAFNGVFSHSTPGSRFAVDIGMPIGTDVLAARGGKIILQERGHVLGGIGDRFMNKANVVKILHADGTIATYGHLQFASLNFREGKVVHAGEVIGKSGNTGYSTGPHLHFAIQSNTNMEITSIPFKFYSNGQAFTPVQGMRIRSDTLAGN